LCRDPLYNPRALEVFMSGKSAVVMALSSMALVVAAWPGARAQTGPQLHVNSQRLESTLEKLGEFGRNPEGGVTRLGYSETDMAAREYVIGLMKQSGLTVRIDPAGNIFGRRDGTEELPVILFGSHIDSVLHGGNYDGDVGSLGAIEVIRALNEAGQKTRHPLEAVIWTNEEGNHFGIGTLGSGIASGVIREAVVQRKDDHGITFADWLRRYGQDPQKLAEARIAAGTVAASLELHIEQGPNLYERKIPIGVVQGIVAVRRWICTTSGFANHAGTTPMNRRRNALAAAAKDSLAVRDVVLSEPGTQVGNVGYMKIEPGGINVIPGRVEFPVELRDLEDAKVERLWQSLAGRIRAIDQQENTETRCEEIDNVQAARADPSIQAAIRQAAGDSGLASIDLPSFAGQDSQNLAKIAPMGMIFIPSKDGISHSPKEYSSPEDIARGAEVLYRTILLLDQRLNR
jgi:beta-ureidopropionase / N-carbamoyl-L-amino-acid hydrolase